jgi:hypothetical protein
VPRYYFHFTDGAHWFTDGNGQELSGLRAVRRHALKDVRALKMALCERNAHDFSEWIMAVVDASGRTLFAIGFDLRPRPVPMEFLAAERQDA